jgi:hypothetical protein
LRQNCLNSPRTVKGQIRGRGWRAFMAAFGQLRGAMTASLWKNGAARGYQPAAVSTGESAVMHVT